MAIGRLYPLAGTFAALFLSIANCNAQDFTWTAGTSGVWSTGGNWLGGIAPPAGGNASFHLKFSPSLGDTNLSATDDLPGIFLLNVLEAITPARTQLGIGSPTASILVTGNNSRITQSGAGQLSLSALKIDPSDGVTTVDGNGNGNLILNGLSGLAAGKTLRVMTGPDSPNGQLISLKGTNSIAGTIQLDSGNLAIEKSQSLGTATLRVNGGTVRIDTANSTISNAIELGGSLVVVNPLNATFSSAITGVVADAGVQLRTNGAAATSTLNLTGASTYTGATILDYGLTSLTPYNDAGILRLSGNGSALNSTSFDIRSGGTLAIDAVPVVVGNRIGDTAQIVLRGGRLQVDSPTSALGAPTEQVGTVSVSGQATIAVGYTGQQIANFTAASLERLQRGSVLFRSPSLTSATPSAQIIFSTPPSLVGGNGTGANTSIIPYAIGDIAAQGNGTGLVTYDPVKGIRLLDNATEYVSTFAAATPTSNVRISFPQLAGDTTINSLFLSGGTFFTGTGTLTVASGTILSASAATSMSIGVPLNFGGAEGHVFAVNGVTITRPISGTGGLTKSGAGLLTLDAVNTFTGPLTINSGKLSFRMSSNLGPGTDAIVIGGGGGLLFNGSSTLTLSRPLEVANGFASLEASGGTMNVTGSISGAGGLRIGTGSSGTIRLNGSNSFQGPVIVNSGTLEFASDSALGSSELWVDSSVRLLGAWTTNRVVRNLSGTINTNGFNANLNGEFIGTDTFTKAGAGTLTLANVSSFSGALSIDGGTLALNNQAFLRSSSIDAKSGAELQVDESGTTGGRISMVGLVTLSGSKLSFIGDSSQASKEKIGSLFLFANTGDNTIGMAQSGTGSFSLTVNTFTQNFSTLIVKADNLGGAAGGPHTRLILVEPPTPFEGFLAKIYSAPTTGTGGESFTIYDTASDAGGVIGVKPLAAADYTAGPVLQESAGTANFLIQAGTTASGTNNTVRSLTFDSGGTLTQTTGQSLLVNGGQVLARSGAPSSLTGGSIGGPGFVTLMVFGDLTLDATLSGAWQKYGPGTLILGPQLPDAGGLSISSGPVRALTPLALADETIGMSSKAGIFDAAGGNVTLGAIGGTGTIKLGGGTLNVGNLGSDFTFNGSFPDSGQFVLVDGGNPNALRTLNLTSVAGGGSITLQSGRLKYTDSNSANPLPLNLAGGVLEMPTSWTTNIPLNVTGNPTVKGDNYLIFSPTAVLSGSGSLNFDGDLSVIIRSNSTFSGELILSGDANVLQIDTTFGANGSLNNASSIRLKEADMSVDYGNSASERLGNSLTIHLEGGRLGLNAPSNATVVEQIGPIRAHPGAEMALLGSTGTSASSLLDLRPAEFVRVNNAVLRFDSPILGAAGAYRAEIHPQIQPVTVGGGAASGPDTSIIPWMVSSRYTTLLTSDPTSGLRFLDPATDFAQGVANLTGPANNLFVAQSQTVDAPTTINSLMMAQTSSATILSGSGSLTITSGLVLARDFLDSRITVPVNFGTNEGILVKGSGAFLYLSGAISGSGGLTIAGAGPVVLEGVNTFTGPIRIVRSALGYAKNESLGPDTSPIQVDGGSLSYTGSQDGVLARDVVITEAGASFGNGGTGQWTVAGSISGPGRVSFGGSNMLVTGNNTFTGDLRISASGTVRFSTDAALGLGALTFSAGTLEPTFDWITNRIIYPDSNANISTAGFDVQWNGPTLGLGSLTKHGIGSLTLRDADQYFGSILAREGALVVEGTLGAIFGNGSDNISGDAGTTLVGNGYWNRETDVRGTLSPGPGVATLTVRELEFWGDSTLDLQINSAASFDQLNVSTLSLSPKVNLTINLGYDPVDFADSFLIVNAGIITTIPGVPNHLFFEDNELSEGETFMVGSQEFKMSYVGGSGNDMVLYAVPEPGTAWMAAVALSLLGLRRRRK
jgi:autotransporter-associated beta strand protein